MTAYFTDLTNQFNQKKVILRSKNGNYFCESEQHLIVEVEFMTYACKECKKLYMGPLYTS